MGRLSCGATVFWLTATLAVGEELPGDISGGLGDGDSGGAKVISRDTRCDGVTISLEEGKVKSVEMVEFNITLTVSSFSEASR